MPGVQVLGVLAHDDEVDVLVARLEALDRAGRAQVGVQPEHLAEGDVDAPEALADRGRDRALERDLVARDRLEDVLRQRRAVLGHDALAGVDWTSHSNATPEASRTRRVASASSGPMPSPGIRVTRWAMPAIVARAGGAARRDRPIPGGPGSPRGTGDPGPNGPAAGARAMIESPPCPGGLARRVKIQEADAKSLLVAQGLPVPAWEVARTPPQARAARRAVPRRPANATRKVVIKAQVLVGGRGKAGGVKLAGTADEAEDVAAQILAHGDQGHPGPARCSSGRPPRSSRSTTSSVRPRSGDQAAHVHRLAPRAASRSSRSPSTTPTRSSTSHADPLLGLPDFAARELAFKIGFGAH